MFGLWSAPAGITRQAWVMDGNGNPLTFNSQEEAIEYIKCNGMTGTTVQQIAQLAEKAKLEMPPIKPKKPAEDQPPAADDAEAKAAAGLTATAETEPEKPAVEQPAPKTIVFGKPAT